MENAKNFTIKGKQLKCAFCGNNKFHELDVRVNTFAATFFAGIWSLLAKRAKAYIFPNCGKKEEFVQE
jgi:hypothetical protein